MRKEALMRLRTYIVIPALAAALALAVVVTPVPSQARSTPTPPIPLSVHLWQNPRVQTVRFTLFCTVPGEEYTVQNTGINIRSAPAGGTVIAKIPKGALFDSNLAVNCGGIQTRANIGTEEQIAGQQWVEGFRHCCPGQRGYVGRGWLAFRKFCNINGC
jgi:hypothetical protein